MYRYFKRFFDILVSFLMIFIFAPIIIIVAILLYFKQGGNPFFLQKRPGLNERIFRIIKFKTMTNERDEFGSLLPDEERLTALGSLVRKLSIDEIPQLFNVLKGDMSFIGPRPLLPEYLDLYNDIQKSRHDVRPGISGWAQVNGRNAISWNKKFELDVFYVNNISLKLDIIIFYRTIKKVALREGISSNSSVTMEKFKGN